MRPWKFILPLLASSLCFAAQPDRIAVPIDSSRMVTLPGNIHRMAQPQYDRGPADLSLPFGPVTLDIPPSPTQQAALEQLLAQQQNPKSANFHKWLTPQQYADRFGLNQNDVNRITAWLQAQGFSNISVANARNAISFSGTAGQLQNVFKTEIHNFDVNGEKHIANATPVSVPAALAGVVTAIRGLTNFRPRPMYVRPAKSTRNGPHPSYTTGSGGQTQYYLAPGDLATIYDINTLYNLNPAIDGTGQKLAIIGQTDVYLADIADFRTDFGLNAITGCATNGSGIITSCDATNFKYLLVGTDLGTPSTCGDLVEADLDIEWSGAIARNAQIIFVNAPATFNSDCTAYTNSGGVNTALSYAIDNNVAPVISMSYGACEGGETLETELHQANLQGITIMNSSGDSGAAACDGGPPNANPPYQAAEFGQTVNYPASSPSVTGVGGTSIPFPTYYSSAYWDTNGSSTTDFGGSALSNLEGTEAAWNDDGMFASYCQGSGSGTAFCNDGGSSTGVPITSQQTAQEDLWISAGGGGVSDCFTISGNTCVSGIARPSWQQTITIPGLTTPQSTYRFVPDVSMMASPNFPGYIYCTPIEYLSQTSPYDTETTSSCANGIAAAADGVVVGNNYVVDPSIVGGTSAASPVFAGIVTLMNQYLGISGGLGNINKTLYQLAATPSNGAFHPIKSGNNTAYCQVGLPAGNPADVICPSTAIIGFSDTTSDATTGYNLANGLGSVDVGFLAEAWKATLVPDFALSAGTPSPSSIPAGQSTTVTLTISAISGSTGMVVNFSNLTSCSGLPAGASCSFNPNAVNFNGTDPATTQVTISTLANMAIPAAASSITITPVNSPNTTTSPIAITVSATNQSYTIASTGSTFSVAPGASASVPITVTGAGSPIAFSPATLPLTYSCTQSTIPAEAQCTFSPSGGNSVSASTVTLTISTTAPTSKLQSPFHRGGQIFYALLLPGLFGIVFAAGSISPQSRKFRHRGLQILGLIMVLGFSTLWMGACGGSGGSSGGQKNGGTPAGTYAIVVNATTGGSTPLTSKFTVNLTVQ